MIVTLQTQGLQTLAQMRTFVPGNEPISFTLEDRHAAYSWMADTLKQFGYMRCTRADKGVLRLEGAALFQPTKTATFFGSDFSGLGLLMFP